MPKITVYYSSATGDLAVKKNQQHLQFLLQGKKIAFEEIDVTQLDKAVRDSVFEKAGTRTLPLVFKDEAFLGVRQFRIIHTNISQNFDTIQELAEDEKLDSAFA